MNEEEVKQWMKEHIAKLSVGAIWAPENSGLVFKKTTEQMLTLERMWDFPETHQVLDNITKTLTDLAYTIDTSSVKVVPLIFVKICFTCRTCDFYINVVFHAKVSFRFSNVTHDL